MPKLDLPLGRYNKFFTLKKAEKSLILPKDFLLADAKMVL